MEARTTDMVLTLAAVIMSVVAEVGEKTKSAPWAGAAAKGGGHSRSRSVSAR